jgi:hypothetical protein
MANLVGNQSNQSHYPHEAPVRYQASAFAWSHLSSSREVVSVGVGSFQSIASCIWRSTWLIVVRGSECEAVALSSMETSLLSNWLPSMISLTSPLLLVTTTPSTPSAHVVLSMPTRAFVRPLTILIDNHWIIFERNSTSNAQIYDIITNQWSSLSLPLSSGLSPSNLSYAVCQYGHHEMLLFQSSTDTSKCQMYYYNVMTAKWRSSSTQVDQPIEQQEPPCVSLAVTINITRGHFDDLKDDGVCHSVIYTIDNKENHWIFDPSINEWTHLWCAQHRSATLLMVADDLLLIWHDETYWSVAIHDIVKSWHYQRDPVAASSTDAAPRTDEGSIVLPPEWHQGPPLPCTRIGAAITTLT